MRTMMILRRLAGFVLLGTAAPALASGCGTPVAGGTQRVAVSFGGVERPVAVYVPQRYQAGQAAPLLLNLHGSGGTGQAQFALSALAADADRATMLVASPDGGIRSGAGFVWHVPGVPTVDGSIPTSDAPDDTGYLVAVIDAVAEALCVDRDRVYATGFSGGGRMASWLGCARADRIAAIAPVVGLRAGRARTRDTALVDEASCRPARAVPVIAFAGAQDRTNPIDGGEGARWGYTMAQAMQRWAGLNRCTQALPSVWIDQRRYRQRYADCNDGAAVEAIVDQRGAHEWGVADNAVMLDFLLAHRLRD